MATQPPQRKMEKITLFLVPKVKKYIDHDLGGNLGRWSYRNLLSEQRIRNQPKKDILDAHI